MPNWSLMLAGAVTKTPSSRRSCYVCMPWCLWLMTLKHDVKRPRCSTGQIDVTEEDNSTLTPSFLESPRISFFFIEAGSNGDRSVTGKKNNIETEWRQISDSDSLLQTTAKSLRAPFVGGVLQTEPSQSWLTTLHGWWHNRICTKRMFKRATVLLPFASGKGVRPKRAPKLS